MKWIRWFNETCVSLVSQIFGSTVLRRVDNGLMALARGLVLAGAFLGISRWRLIIASIAVSWATYAVTTAFIQPKILLPPWFGLVVTLFFLCPAVWVTHAWFAYREDNIFGDFMAPYSTPVTRVSVVLVFPLAAIFLALLNDKFQVLWMALPLVILSPDFHVYLLFQQTPRNPLRLRPWLRGLRKSGQVATQR